MERIVKAMEEERTCKTCVRFKENGFCGLQTAAEVSECISGGLAHWSSAYNQQFAIDLDSMEDE